MHIIVSYVVRYEILSHFFDHSKISHLVVSHMRHEEGSKMGDPLSQSDVSIAMDIVGVLTMSSTESCLPKLSERTSVKRYPQKKISVKLRR